MKKKYLHKYYLTTVLNLELKAIEMLISSIEEYSPETIEHGIRVGYYAGCIAEFLGFDKNHVNEVKLAGTLHDIGKLEIPSHILNKSNTLTNEEYRIIQKHPIHTSNILKRLNNFKHISKITLHHHERYDGSGYPECLQGDNIPFESQIISIADAFDAMTSDRTYRKALSVSCAIDLLKEEAGRQFHPELVSQASQLLSESYMLAPRFDCRPL